MNKANRSEIFQYSYDFKAITKDLLTPKGFKSLDGIRAMFMLWIILYHSHMASMLFSPEGKTPEFRLKVLENLNWYEYWLQGANYTLDAFFSLSGFLIAFLLFKEWDKSKDLDLKRFYYRRFMRLMPVYLFFIIACFLLLIAFNVEEPNPWYLITNIFYINNFFEFDKNPLPWTWSLAVEEQFYFIFPVFLLLIKNKSFMKWMIFLFLTSFWVRYLVVINNETLSTSPLTQLFTERAKYVEFVSVLYDNLYTRYGAFICGISAAYLYRYHLEALQHFLLHTIAGKLLGYLSIGVTFYLLLAHNVLNPNAQPNEFWRLVFHVSHRNIFTACMTLLMLLMLLNAPYVSYITKLFNARIWYPLAQITYSSYLVHMFPVMASAYIFREAFGMTFGDGYYWFFIAVFGVAFTYLLAAILYYTIEAPLMRWRDFRTGRSLRDNVNKQSVASA